MKSWMLDPQSRPGAPARLRQREVPELHLHVTAARRCHWTLPAQSARPTAMAAPCITQTGPCLLPQPPPPSLRGQEKTQARPVKLRAADGPVESTGSSPLPGQPWASCCVLQTQQPHVGGQQCPVEQMVIRARQEPAGEFSSGLPQCTRVHTASVKVKSHGLSHRPHLLRNRPTHGRMSLSSLRLLLCFISLCAVTPASPVLHLPRKC